MRVALLQNFVAPYRVPLYERLRERLAALKVFVSTPMESDRDWQVDWGSLDVEVQRNLTLRQRLPAPGGFTRTLQVHVPYDTVPRLWRWRPDAVISVELGPRTLQVVLYGMLRPATRLLVWCKLSEHTERGFGGVRLAVRRFILARADGVMVNGESGARYIARFGVPDDRIFRVNQPIDVETFTRVPRTRPDGARTRLLCCGTLSERKNVVPFLRQLDSWARIHPGEQLEIWWLGDGDRRAELEAFACAPNLSQRFIGSVPYADLPTWYSQADVLAFPTLMDEWGLVVNEAMAAGLPVLGSVHAQAVEELVAEGVTGWTFDPASDESVWAALDRMRATAPRELAAMREAGRRRIAGLTPDATASKMFNALRVISESRKGTPARAAEVLPPASLAPPGRGLG